MSDIVCWEVEGEVKGFYRRCRVSHMATQLAPGSPVRCSRKICVCGFLHGKRMRLAEPNKLHRKSGFEQALSLYDLPPNATVHLISLSENETYKVKLLPAGSGLCVSSGRDISRKMRSLRRLPGWSRCARTGWSRRRFPSPGSMGNGSRSCGYRSCAQCEAATTWFSLPGKTAANPLSAWICANALRAWVRSPRKMHAHSTSMAAARRF